MKRLTINETKLTVKDLHPGDLFYLVNEGKASANTVLDEPDREIIVLSMRTMGALSGQTPSDHDCMRIDGIIYEEN